MKTYRVINHNETLLGEFLSRTLALAEAREYRRQTGNAAYMVVTYYDRSWRVWIACKQDGNGDQVGEAGYGMTKAAAMRECEELNQEVL